MRYYPRFAPNLGYASQNGNIQEIVVRSPNGRDAAKRARVLTRGSLFRGTRKGSVRLSALSFQLFLDLPAQARNPGFCQFGMIGEEVGDVDTEGGKKGNVVHGFFLAGGAERPPVPEDGQLLLVQILS